MTRPPGWTSLGNIWFLRKVGPDLRRKLWVLIAAAGTVWALLFAFHLTKPLPEGLSVSGPAHDAAEMEFLFDLTYQRDGDTVVEQEIFDRILAMIDEADRFVVMDMFLFDGRHKDDKDYRPLSSQITDHLLSREKANPELDVRFITDEINNFYGVYVGEEIQRLRAGGIDVVTTRLSSLRDSNPAYSAGWRMIFGWMGTAGPGWLPNFLSHGGPKVPARGYLKVLNFKANHRKLIVTDKGCLVASANPHDASSYHSNIAFFGTGPLCTDLLEAERAVASFSGGAVEGWPVYEAGEETSAPAGGPARTDAGPGAEFNPPADMASAIPSTNGGTVRFVTEKEILKSLLEAVESAGSGDRVDVAMFYLSHRKVVEALVDADGRGASVRLVLDPNKDAFGREKGGIPNRQVAYELVSRSDGRIQVRWYDTHGEQFHTKLVMVTRADSVVVLGGSANLTRRNIGDFNLEADLRFALPRDAPLALAVGGYFERVFANQGGSYTSPFEAYRNDSLLKRIRYRVEEFTGFCSY